MCCVLLWPVPICVHVARYAARTWVLALGQVRCGDFFLSEILNGGLPA
jgi:hypothetical protein